MVLGLIGALAPGIIKIIDKLVPDKAQAAKMKLELLRMEQEGELKFAENSMKIALKQLEVNAVAAASNRLFNSGWRPAVGWICASGLAYQVLIRPFLQLILHLCGIDFDMTSLSLETLMPIMFGMLGLGAYRTYEKVKFNRRTIFDQIRNEQGTLDQEQVELIDRTLDKLEKR